MGAMAVAGTWARTALSMIGLSTGWRPPLLVVVAVAAPQSLADRHVKDTHMTRLLAKQQELLPMVPPLLEPSVMMPMAGPTMVETIQMVPTATPTMVETAVPMMQPMQMGAPAVSAMPMMGSAMATPAAAMQGIGGFGTQ